MRSRAPRTRVGSILLACVAGAALPACEAADESRPGTDPGPVLRDSAGVTITESAHPAWTAGEGWSLDPVAVLSIGSAEGEPPYVFSRVGDAMLSGETLLVSDAGAGRLRYYDTQGRHLASIGGQGDGPGEFSPVASMRLCRLPDGSVAVTDDNRSRVHVASPERAFVSTIRVETVGGQVVWPHDCLADGSWVGARTVASRDGAVSRSALAVHVTGSDGHVGPEILRLRGRSAWFGETGLGGLPIPFEPQGFVGADGDRLVVGRGADPEVEYRDRDGRLLRIVRRTSLRRVPAASVLDRHARFWLDRAPDERTRDILAGFFARDLQLPDSVPAYQSVTADGVGHVWVERFRIVDDTVTDRDVFDREGRWLGTVRMPPRFTVHEIGPDHVLGVQYDTLGVQRVRMYRIVRTSSGRAAHREPPAGAAAGNGRKSAVSARPSRGSRHSPRAP